MAPFRRRSEAFYAAPRLKHSASSDYLTHEEKLHCPVGWSVDVVSSGRLTRIAAEPQHVSPETVSVQVTRQLTVGHNFDRGPSFVCLGEKKRPVEMNES